MEIKVQGQYMHGPIRLAPDYEIIAIGYYDELNWHYHKDCVFSYRVFDWGDFFTR